VYGLAACAYAERLYVSDWDNDLMHALPLYPSDHEDEDVDAAADDDDDDDDDSVSWSVANQPAGLSLTLAGNAQPPSVLVACHGAGLIQEWSPDGILMRQIELSAEARLVWHAVPLSCDELVVSHEGSTHCLTVISTDDAQLLHSCRQV